MEGGEGGAVEAARAGAGHSQRASLGLSFCFYNFTLRKVQFLKIKKNLKFKIMIKVSASPEAHWERGSVELSPSRGGPQCPSDGRAERAGLGGEPMSGGTRKPAGSVAGPVPCGAGTVWFPVIPRATPGAVAALGDHFSGTRGTSVRCQHPPCGALGQSRSQPPPPSTAQCPPVLPSAG